MYAGVWLGAEINGIFLRGEGAAARPLEVDSLCAVQAAEDTEPATG